MKYIYITLTFLLISINLKGQKLHSNNSSSKAARVNLLEDTHKFYAFPADTSFVINADLDSLNLNISVNEEIAEGEHYHLYLMSTSDYRVNDPILKDIDSSGIYNIKIPDNIDKGVYFIQIRNETRSHINPLQNKVYYEDVKEFGDSPSYNKNGTYYPSWRPYSISRIEKASLANQYFSSGSYIYNETTYPQFNFSVLTEKGEVAYLPSGTKLESIISGEEFELDSNGSLNSKLLNNESDSLKIISLPDRSNVEISNLNQSFGISRDELRTKLDSNLVYNNSLEFLKTPTCVSIDNKYKVFFEDEISVNALKDSIFTDFKLVVRNWNGEKITELLGSELEYEREMISEGLWVSNVGSFEVDFPEDLPNGNYKLQMYYSAVALLIPIPYTGSLDRKKLSVISDIVDVSINKTSIANLDGLEYIQDETEIQGIVTINQTGPYLISIVDQDKNVVFSNISTSSYDGINYTEDQLVSGFYASKGFLHRSVFNASDGILNYSPFTFAITANKDNVYTIDKFYAEGCPYTQTEGQLTVTLILGEEDLDASINIFPNPSASLITVDLSSLNSPATLSIIDQNGKSLQTIKDITEKSKTIDVSSYTSGTYMLNISTKEGSKSFRVVKQ